MPYKVLYFDEVKQDIKEAKSWYKEQLKGLDKRFAKAIKESINRIIKSPEAYDVRYKNIRIAHPEVFPYAIHFYIDEQKNWIVIIAVIHNSRNPAYTAMRINKSI